MIAIIGGGISGLSAAYELSLRGIPFVLLEKADRCGGVVLTERIAGYTIDAGPDALLTQKPAAIDLCRAVGLGDRLQAQAGRESYVVRRGTLRQLPEGAVLGMPTRWAPFVKTTAFSWPGKVRMAAEFFRPASAPHGDESIGAFFERRFGREALEYLAEPLLAGIHGGDPATLSMLATFPRFIALEQQHGSVLRGLRSAIRHSALAAPAGAPFMALTGGMAELTNAMRAALPRTAIRTGVEVQRIESGADEYRVHLAAGGWIEANAVIVAAPPPAAGQLIQLVDQQAADLCAAIRMASAVTVALGFARSAVGGALNGSGFVVPRAEGLRVRAVSWVSSKWRGRAPLGHVLFRAYYGGATDPSAIDLHDATLAGLAHAELTPLLDIVGEPDVARVYRWRNATPQMEVGHLDRMARIDRRLALHPGLFVTAAGFRGTGIADCVADARHQAALAADWLAKTGASRAHRQAS